MHAVGTAGLVEQVQAGHVGDRGALTGALMAVSTRVISSETVLELIAGFLYMDVHQGVVFVADALDVAKRFIIV